MIDLKVHDVMKRWPIEDEKANVMVFSPPYWLARDYGHPDQLGQEPLHDCLRWATGDQPSHDCCYVCNTRLYMQEARRVLHRSGVVFMVIDDSYASRREHGLKPKDKVGIPWRVALALQADGWYWRSEIPWWKTNSMTEKVADRPTDSHEHVLMFTKNKTYYTDKYSVLLPSRKSRYLDDLRYGSMNLFGEVEHDIEPGGVARRTIDWQHEQLNLTASYLSDKARMLINTLSGDTTCLSDIDGSIVSIQSPTGANNHDHFAGFHPEMIRPLILFTTSRHGVCAGCGAQWKRVIRKTTSDYTDRNTKSDYTADGNATHGQANSSLSKITLVEGMAWKPTCECENTSVTRPIVLDPFVGTGTTGSVAAANGCDFIGFDVNPDNIEICRQSLGMRL